MKKEYMLCCLSLVLIFAALPGTADASPCTWAVDLTALQVTGPVDKWGDTASSFDFSGPLVVQRTGQTVDSIVLSISSLNALASPPSCGTPSDEASASRRDSTIGVNIPSVAFNGHLFSTFVSYDRVTKLGTVDLASTNRIAPLTPSDVQRGAASATWNIYSATEFNMIAGLMRDAFLFKFTGPFLCQNGGSGEMTYNAATNSSVGSVTDCAVIPWSLCTGSLTIFPFPPSGPSSVIVSSPSLRCSGVFSNYVTDITFTDAGTVITPDSADTRFSLSGTADGTLVFPDFTVPVRSTMNNLSMNALSVTGGGDLTLFAVSGAAFKQCFGKWYSYDQSSVVTIHNDGSTTGNVNINMPEISDIIQVVLDGTVTVGTNVPGGPATYPDDETFYGNCAQ